MLFNIRQSHGHIKRNFNDINDYFKKVCIDDLELILTLIEKETSNFFYVRLNFKFKIFIIILLILTLLLTLLYFLYFKNKISSVICICSIILIFVIYMVCKHSVFRRYYRHSLKKIYILLDEVNKKLFSKDNFYMMVDPEMNYVALYTIPDEIMASIQIKNFIEQVDEDDHVEKNNYLSPNTKKVILSKDMSMNKTTDIFRAYLEIKQSPLGLIR